jgi:hypothetical protein
MKNQIKLSIALFFITMIGMAQPNPDDAIPLDPNPTDAPLDSNILLLFTAALLLAFIVFQKTKRFKKVF